MAVQYAAEQRGFVSNELLAACWMNVAGLRMDEGDFAGAQRAVRNWEILRWSDEIRQHWSGSKRWWQC